MSWNILQAWNGSNTWCYICIHLLSCNPNISLLEWMSTPPICCRHQHYLLIHLQIVSTFQRSLSAFYLKPFFFVFFLEGVNMYFIYLYTFNNNTLLSIKHPQASGNLTPNNFFFYTRSYWSFCVDSYVFILRLWLKVTFSWTSVHPLIQLMVTAA